MTSAKMQRLWAAAAKERWKRHLAARKGAETKAAKRRAAFQKAGATVQLHGAFGEAKSQLITELAQKAVTDAKKILDEPAVTQAEKTRQALAISEAEKTIARLKSESLSPAETSQIVRQAQVQVKLGREMMNEAVVSFYQQMKDTGKIERISRWHEPGTVAKVSSRDRHGIIADRKDGALLSEQTLEEHLHKMLKAASVVSKREPRGKLYATFSYFEYGKNKPRSGYYIATDPSGDPSAGIHKNEFGYFFQSFDSTAYLGGADDAASLEVKLRAILHRKLEESGGNNAAVVVGFQLKSFVHHTEEERKEYDRALWRKLKRAQRAAQKKQKETGEVQWTNLEDLTKDEQ